MDTASTVGVAYENFVIPLEKPSPPARSDYRLTQMPSMCLRRLLRHFSACCTHLRNKIDDCMMVSIVVSVRSIALR